MKILHVDTEKTWRGGQQQAVYLHEALISRDIASGFVTPCGSKTGEYLKNKKLPVHYISFYGEWDFIHGLSLAMLTRKEGYDILHLHSAHALSWGLWAKLFRPSLKLIGVRRVDFSIKKNCLSYLKYSNHLLDIIIAISDNIKKVLISDGIPGNKIVTIHSGVDLQKHHQVAVPTNFRSNWQIPADAIIVGTIAAFVGHKDYPTLLKSAALVLKKKQNVRFMAVGEGVLLPEMKKMAQQLGISERFVFCGFQKEVGVFLKSFDIFVISSRKEGLGTSVIDALAIGLPIIGTRTGGIPEMVEDGVNGLLVDPQNPDLLAEAILTLIDDRSLRDEMSSRAKDSAKQFSIEQTVEKNIALYREISNAGI